jgi:hypothetical protein
VVRVNAEKQKPKYLEKMDNMKELTQLVDEVIVPHVKAGEWEIKTLRGNNRSCWIASKNGFRFIVTIDNI